MKRRVLILTSHVMLPGFRRASVHFVADSWAAAGHDVHFTTVGHSWLTRLKDRRRFELLSAAQANRYVETPTGLRAGAYLPPLHAVSTRNPIGRLLARPAFRLYGARLPRFVREVARDADVVVIESGTALAFFGAVKAASPHARTLYFCRDLLRGIGADPALQAIEREIVPAFDAICVPSRRLAGLLPPGGRVHVLPQGVDAGRLDAGLPSPYAPGTLNAISAGDMLFDGEAVAAMAAAAPEVTFHVFGAPWRGTPPRNVRLHGEQGYDDVVPYMQHADFGIAPYRNAEAQSYLAESSLKLAQYSWCRLPILLPDAVAFTRANAIAYAAGETDWRGKIDRALAMPHSDGFRDGLLSWDEIARLTLDTALGA